MGNTFPPIFVTLCDAQIQPNKTSKGLETETGNKNRNKKVPQSWPKQPPPPVSVSLKCSRNRNRNSFQGGGGSLRKFWNKFCFYLFLFPTLIRLGLCWMRLKRNSWCYVATKIYSSCLYIVNISLFSLFDAFLQQ